MRILVVTNLYPPHHQGGYELRCQQVAEHLHRQGHAVRVATSSYRVSGSSEDARIEEDRVNDVAVTRYFRQHRLEKWRVSGRVDNLEVVRRQFADAKRFGEILDQVNPDVVCWWNLEGITKIPMGMAASRNIPSVHCIDDNWMIREFGPAGDADDPFWFGFWAVEWGPRLLRPIVRGCLAPVERHVGRSHVPTRVFGSPPYHACFISEFRRVQYQLAGLVAPSSEVIHGGVSPQTFHAARTASDYADGELRLLYAGFVDRKRGLHTLVEAIGLMPEPQRGRVRLSVAFPGPVGSDEYFDEVRRRIGELGLTDRVSFLRRIPHQDMPSIYARHHMLVFTSTLNEGMPMVMMEAMCAGCAVISTGSGGAIELVERAGLPIFPKDHPFALGRLLAELERDRPRVAAIALRGQETVQREFTMDQMLEKTTRALTRAASASQLTA